MARPFRTPESHHAEEKTRGMIGDFLLSRGFKISSNKPERHGQTIVATRTNGTSLTMRVRLCWVRESERRSAKMARTYSATQLIGKIENNDPEESLREKVNRETSNGVTHFLIVQREGDSIVLAGLVPLSDLLSIWCAQRDMYETLIKTRQLGRIKKNPAINGSSPTLYLHNDQAPQAAAVFWSYHSVENLVSLMSARLADEDAEQDTKIEGTNYTPQDGDWREVVERQIKERRGQQSFRQALCRRYNNRCLVTNCEILAVLEAAHINPYRGENDNHPENGLLLRADIHTLFDLNLIGIEPEELLVQLHPSIESEYGSLAGKALNCGQGEPPSSVALKFRYEEFKRSFSP